jgi:transposase
MTKLTPAQRQHIITSHACGKSTASLAKSFRVSMGTIKHWIRAGKERGGDLSDRPRRGRPPKVTPSLQAKMKRMAKKGKPATKIARRVATAVEGGLDRTTVGRHLKGGRHPLEYAPVRGDRVLSEANKKARLKFVEEFPLGTEGCWVFLDATVFPLYTGGGPKLRRAWQGRDRRLVQTKGTLVAHYHVYAAVAKGFKSKLYPVPPSCEEDSPLPKSKVQFEGHHFVGMMQQLLKELKAHFKGKKFCIIMDHAPQHLSRATKEALYHLSMPILWDFPAQSFDLNVIELVWAKLKALVEQRRPITKRGYMKVIKESWRELKQTTIDGIIDTVPRRMQEVKKKKGDWVKR